MNITAFELIHGRVLCTDIVIAKKDFAALAALIATATIFFPDNVLAASTDIPDRIDKATQPIKDLLIGIADPVCYLVFVYGLLEAMLGKGSSGLKRMKYAALGYAGLNWLPVLMQILREAKP